MKYNLTILVYPIKRKQDHESVKLSLGERHIGKFESEDYPDLDVIFNCAKLICYSINIETTKLSNLNQAQERGGLKAIIHILAEDITHLCLYDIEENPPSGGGGGGQPKAKPEKVIYHDFTIRGEKCDRKVA